MNVVVVTTLAVAVAALAVALVVTLRRAAGQPAADPALREAVREHALRLERVAATVDQGSAGQEALRRDVGHTARALAGIAARLEERRERDEQAQAGFRRIESVLLGASARGRMGENVVAQALRELPPDILERDVALGGKTVEFALRLPDGRRLPVDSKWAAMAEAEALETAEGDERTRLQQAVEREAVARAREVAKYLGPASAPFAVAAVPDPVHAALRRAHLDAYRYGVLLVPYSTALPTILALYQLCCRLDASAADVGGIVADVGAALDAIERALENSVERAAKMTGNAAGEIRRELGKARGALGRAPADGDEVVPLRAVE